MEKNGELMILKICDIFIIWNATWPVNLVSYVAMAIYCLFVTMEIFVEIYSKVLLNPSCLIKARNQEIGLLIVNWLEVTAPEYSQKRTLIEKCRKK